MATQCDWWTFQCATCGWKVADRRTVNHQQSVAEVLIRLHIQEHEQPRAEERKDR